VRWTPAIIATQSRREAGEGKNERGGPRQYLKCVDAHVQVVYFIAVMDKRRCSLSFVLERVSEDDVDDAVVNDGVITWHRRVTSVQGLK